MTWKANWNGGRRRGGKGRAIRKGGEERRQARREGRKRTVEEREGGAWEEKERRNQAVNMVTLTLVGHLDLTAPQTESDIGSLAGSRQASENKCKWNNVEALFRLSRSGMIGRRV